jgi:hypothetical protein
VLGWEWENPMLFCCFHRKPFHSLVVWVFFTQFCAFSVLLGQPDPRLPTDVPGTQNDKVLDKLDKETGLHEWHRFVRGFRKGHHFGLSLGVARPRWQLGEFSGLEDYKTTAAIVKFRYSYHFRLSYAFGVFLGSSVGIHQELEDEDNDYRADLGAEVPGIWGGLIYNLHPEWRFFLGLERYLSRYAPFYVYPSGAREKLSVSMTEYDFVFGVDHFFAQKWALRAELHYRYAQHSIPDDGNSQNSLIQTEFSRREPWFGLGIVFHYQ